MIRNLEFSFKLRPCLRVVPQVTGLVADKIFADDVWLELITVGAVVNEVGVCDGVEFVEGSG